MSKKPLPTRVVLSAKPIHISFTSSHTSDADDGEWDRRSLRMKGKIGTPKFLLNLPVEIMLYNDRPSETSSLEYFAPDPKHSFDKGLAAELAVSKTTYTDVFQLIAAGHKNVMIYLEVQGLKFSEIKQETAWPDNNKKLFKVTAIDIAFELEP